MAAGQSTQRALNRRGINKGRDGVDIEKEARETVQRTYSRDGLTPKQEEFAVAVANSLTLSDAYKKAYNAENMKAAHIYTAASQLMSNPKVARRVADLIEFKTQKSMMADVKRVRQHVFDRLMMESINEQSSPNARIKALELLGKIRGIDMFVNGGSNGGLMEGEGGEENNPDAAALEAKLRSKLRRQFGFDDESS